jgi:diguanylate cyclase (GGDEF)-like protein
MIRGWIIPFASDALKQEYHAELLPEKIRLTRVLISLGTLFNIAFFFLDEWAIPSSQEEVLLVRVILLSAFIITFCSTWSHQFERLYSWIIAFAIGSMGLALNTMIYLAEPTDLARDVYYGGLLLATIGLFTMTYVSLYLSLTLSILMIVGYVAIAVFAHGYLQASKIVVLTANLFFFISTAIIGLFAQSVRERYSRENHLLRHSLQRDVKIKEEEKSRADYLARHDALTSLPNRVRFDVEASSMIETAIEQDQQAAFMFIDLDGFKAVNDTHGHAVGDRVLKVVATRLTQCLRKSDIVCRLGGDEFVVGLLIPKQNIEVINVVGEKISAAVGEEIVLRGNCLRLSASIGVAIAPRDGDNLPDVLAVADKLMYKVKRSGKAGIALASGDAS